MIKALIAEDELPLLRGIKFLIEKLNPVFTVVSCAKNGKEAIDYIDQHDIDILFTDINMPVVDGITLLQYVSKHHPHIQTVVISGYADFEYAKSAMKCGVKNYILKPIDVDELTQLLNTLAISIKNISYTQKKEALSQLLFSTSTKVPYYSLGKRTYLLYLCAGSYQFFSSDNVSVGKIYWNAQNLNEFFSAHLSQSDSSWIFLGTSPYEYIVVLGLDSDLDISKLANNLYTHLASEMPLTIALSCPITILSDLNTIFRNLGTRMSQQLIYGKSALLWDNTAKPYYMLSLSDKGKLQHALQTKNFESFKQVLLQLKAQLQHYEASQKNVDYLLNQILILLSHSLQSPPFLENSISELVSSTWSYDNLFDDYLALSKSMFNGIILDTRNHEELMKSVDDYIISHISSSLTTKTLSTQFGLVAPYLSKLFKDYKGMSPSQYIQNIRLENAKKLLIECPSMLAKDIAETLGYNNALYFSKTFKKNTGFYPSEYRERYKSS